MKEVTAKVWVDQFCKQLNVGSLFGYDIPKYEFFKDKLMEWFQEIHRQAYQDGLELGMKDKVQLN